MLSEINKIHFFCLKIYLIQVVFGFIVDIQSEWKHWFNPQFQIRIVKKKKEAARKFYRSKKLNKTN